jgi:Xaa-Pro aminopeptidase|tara:strand:- start:9163 stop:10914 length:1752 start_codon:yes stop_codon:yes gene_type:complete
MLKTEEKLNAIRSLMDKHDIDACIVDQTDEFQNEFLPEYSKRLEWLTEFSGSAGEALITKKSAYLFVDGRYTLQAKNEVNNSAYKVFNYLEKTPIELLNSLKLKKINFAIDGNIATARKFKALKEQTNENIKINLLEKNLIDYIWNDRPIKKPSEVWHHKKQYHGSNTYEKIKIITNTLKKNNSDYLLITSCESICWLLNIRAGDLPYTPIFMSRMLINKKGECYLFADVKGGLKFPKLIKITILKGNSISDFISKKVIKKSIIADPRTISVNMYNMLKYYKIKIKLMNDPIEILKAQKNKIEVQGMRNAHLRDGVALTKSIFWIKNKVNNDKKLTELDAIKKIDTNRSKNKSFFSLSFPTIAGSGPNGAIVHYHADKKSNRKIKNSDLFLIDSGGQYFDGTTDVTRTIAFKKTTSEQRKMNTLVLKGHIAVATSKFNSTETGTTLNDKARKYLRGHNCDFDHGTGHGVGYFLNVHEGPHSISSRSKVKFKSGMVVSNEPGFYKKNAYGIRIENLVVVIKNKNKLELETLTLAPIDRYLIDLKLLKKDELDWLNAYHQKVYTKLHQHLNLKERAWLKIECAKL